jgi:GTP-binding protein HflX
MNALTGTHVYVADKLFATLDPTTRKYTLPSGKQFYLSDTVGFIKKLPHQLVDAFKATLEEVYDADILLLVLDISHEKAFEQKQAVEAVLQEIGVIDKPVIQVINKIDLIGTWAVIERFMKDFPECVPISAQTGEGLATLLEKIDQHIPITDRCAELAIPDASSHILPLVYQNMQVVEVRYMQGKTHLKVNLRQRCPKELKKYMTKK